MRYRLNFLQLRSQWPFSDQIVVLLPLKALCLAFSTKRIYSFTLTLKSSSTAFCISGFVASKEHIERDFILLTPSRGFFRHHRGCDDLIKPLLPK
jgi:hypothetical protein